MNRRVALILRTVWLLCIFCGSVQAQENVIEMATYEGWAPAWDVVVVGDIACVAMAERGLVLVDISDPAVPVQVGQYTSATLPTVYDVAAIGRFVYCVGDGLLEVVDVGSPSRPTFVAHVGDDPDYDARAITIHGDSAYIASVHWLHTVDVSDPALPIWCSRVENPYGGLDARPAGISAADTLLSVVLSNGRLEFYDRGREGNFGLWRELDVGSHGWSDVVLADSFAYCAAGRSGLKVVGIYTGPYHLPQIIASIAIPDTCQGILKRDSLVYVAARSGLWIYNVSNPISPVQVGVCSTAVGACGLMLRDSQAVVAAGKFGVRVLNLSDQTAPYETGSLNHWSRITGLFYYNGYLFAAEPSLGLSVLNATDPLQVQQAAMLNLPSSEMSSDIRHFGHYAALSSGSGMLSVVDIGEPASPMFAGSCTVPGITDVAVVGDWAYALSTTALIRINLTSPEHPSLEDSLPMMLLPEGELIQQDTLLGVPNLNWGMVLMDVSDSTLPDSITHFGVGQWYYAAAFYDNYLLTTFWDSLYVLSLSALPDLPRVGTVRLNEVPGFICVTGQHALIGSRGRRLWVVKLADPTQPEVVGYTTLSGPPIAIAVDGTTAYVSCTTSLHVLDISAALAVEPQPGVSSALPVSLALQPCFPNPFNASTTISFVLPRAARVNLALYDITGRQVKLITDQMYRAGSHALQLSTPELASGVYFVHLTSDAGKAVQKVALIK